MREWRWDWCECENDEIKDLWECEQFDDSQFDRILMKMYKKKVIFMMVSHSQ